MCRLRPGEGRTESQATALGEETDRNGLCQVRMNGQKEAEIGDSQSYKTEYADGTVRRQCHLE